MRAGTSLAALLKDGGLKPTARELVYFGADEIAHGGGQPEKYEQNFARSLGVEDAMNPDVLLVWEMDGAPVPPKNGGPVRSLVAGWYGVRNANGASRSSPARRT
jgi:DMSO/TMAO reductase YedYZ molybdopterin-dependent catalytic subunit